MRINVKKSSTVGAVVGLIFVILLLAVLNLTVFPFLIMIVLGALGYEVSFLVALAFWVLAVFILNFIRSIFK